MKIDSDLVQEYEEHGAVCLRGVFDPVWVDIVRNGIEKNLENPGPFAEKLKGEEGDGHYFDDYCNWQTIEEFKKYAFESPVGAIAGAFTQSKEIAFYHEHVLVKEPGTYKETPWHHDQSYYPIDGEKVCSIWMPVDAVPQETCVRFVSGSHRWGWFLPRKFETNLPYERVNELWVDRDYHPVPNIQENKKQWKILSWDLQPGDCIVFHMKCLHGAPGNLSRTCHRRVLSTRWLGDDAVIARRPWAVSPPTYGGLQFGDRAVSSEFPLIWRKDN